MHGPGDVRFETLDDPKILHPTDAIIRTAVTCVCGSDLWPWRGLEPIGDAHPTGHDYVGFVEEVGTEVTSATPGQFVIGSSATSDNTCANCRNGFQSNCPHREFTSTCQAEYVRIPHARGTPVATDEVPDEQLRPGLPAVPDGVARINDLTNGIGADSVLECVGTTQAMRQALHSARP